MEAIRESFRFNIGHFECLVIRDAISPMELDTLFPNIPTKQLQQLFTQYNIQPGEIMDVMCLFIISPGLGAIEVRLDYLIMLAVAFIIVFGLEGLGIACSRIVLQE